MSDNSPAMEVSSDSVFSTRFSKSGYESIENDSGLEASIVDTSTEEVGNEDVTVMEAADEDGDITIAENEDVDIKKVSYEDLELKKVAYEGLNIKKVDYEDVDTNKTANEDVDLKEAAYEDVATKKASGFNVHAEEFINTDVGRKFVSVKKTRTKEATSAVGVQLKEREKGPRIKEVWSHNLREEFHTISHLVRRLTKDNGHCYCALDTEYPGVVHTPEYFEDDEYGYQKVKMNVNNLKLIQLGITLFDSRGVLPAGVCTWQFNFQFDCHVDQNAASSMDLLTRAGIVFNNHRLYGINQAEFAEYFFMSGLVLARNVTWITFHSSYDFAYLLRQLLQRDLPDFKDEFLEELQEYFPEIYDIRRITRLSVSLQSLANQLQVVRIGRQHQAGSDSLLTGQVFFSYRRTYFPDGVNYFSRHGGKPLTSYRGLIYGLESNHQF